MLNIKKVLEDIMIRLNLMADYVVETKTSGLWEYTKWKSGKVEMIGRRQVTILTSNWVASGNGYYASIYASTYPFKLAKIPKIDRNAWTSKGYYAAIGSNVSAIMPSTTITGGFSLLRLVNQA